MLSNDIVYLTTTKKSQNVWSEHLVHEEPYVIKLDD